MGGKGWGLGEALVLLSLLPIPCFFSEVAKAGERGSLGSPRSAGLSAGIELIVGHHIFSVQTEPLLRVKEEAVTKYARTTGIGKTMTNKPEHLATLAQCLWLSAP